MSDDVIRVPANAVRLVQGLEPSPGLEGCLQQLDEAEFWRAFVTPEVREAARKKALPSHNSWYSSPLTSVDWQPVLDEVKEGADRGMTKRVKHVELTQQDGKGTTYHIGYAYLKKNEKGDVEIDVTVTSLPLIEQLGGTKIKGIVENYEKDDL